jgi:hypothetical protein
MSEIFSIIYIYMDIYIYIYKTMGKSDSLW